MSDALIIAILGFLMTGPLAAVATTIYLDNHREKQRVKREAEKTAKDAKQKEAQDAENRRKAQEAAEETINALVDEYGLKGIKEAIEFKTAATEKIDSLQKAYDESTATHEKLIVDHRELLANYETLGNLAEDLGRKFDAQLRLNAELRADNEAKDGVIAERDRAILTLAAERDVYLARATAAEAERDAANARAGAAEKELESCNAARRVAEAERDTARAERDSARADAEQWKTRLELKKHDTGPLTDLPITKET